MCCANTPPLPPPPPPPPPHVPPPPPPPPPHPPLPPLLPSRAFGSCKVQRRSMKKLNWDTIPSQRVLGRLNIWTSTRPQRDLVLDIRSMEELFSHIDRRASLRNPRVTGLKKCDGVDLFANELQITILDSKKSMNIGIFLRHFKRPVKEMVQDIREGNWLKFGSGKLKDLCKLLPEDSEVKQLLSFSGNLSVLPEADQFMVQLVKVPGYEERLKMMVLREEFSPFIEEVKSSVAVMTKAANGLLDCDDLHSVIRLVLKAGNYMNAGGFSENAIGFRMTSLLKLADTKANKPGMNLMHYVAKQAEDIDPELLTFPSQLEHIGMAARICKDEVITDFEKEVKKIKEVKLYTSRQPNLLKQIESFLVSAEAKLAVVASSLQELKALSNAVAEYFCEDPATFKLEECCSIFHSFCKRFDTAVQENRDREAAEKRRKLKESMRTAAKRLSKMSCQRSDPDLDSSGLESALRSFLSGVPEGLTRSKKNLHSPFETSPNEHASQMVQSVKKINAVSSARRERPEKIQPKQRREDEQLENKEAEKTREITQKVLRDPNGCLNRDRDLGTSTKLERAEDTPATPRTPRPRTRDYFFSNNGEMGSPWTILSPFSCTPRNPGQLNSPAQRRRLSLALTNDDPEDGVWLGNRDSHLPNLSSQGRLKLLPGGSASLPDCPIQRAMSSGPIVRSVSMNEARQSPASHFWMENLFQKRISKRCYSSGSRTECTGEKEALVCSVPVGKAGGEAGSSGFISFFRRIGGRNKPGSVEEDNKGRNA
ncbi:FH2 domain containing 3 [Antennarius striatus]|uniref:FH2 domain containing 3 n=1 Tax=Antennarius striatus TaxID=241820 RepID=UPI0035AF2063